MLNILNKKKSISLQNYNLISFISLSIFCAIAIYIWSGDNFLSVNGVWIGEAFEAYHGALNIVRYGWQFGGLQDMATNPSLSAHTVLYIHHPNFGLYFSYLLHLLGISNIETQNLLSGLGTVLGLFSGWYLCFKLTKSSIISSFLLIFLAIDLQFAERWAFNIHRAFGYLAMFLPVYFSLKWFDKPAKFNVNIFLIFIGLILALGQDYMAFFTVILILCLVPICLGKVESKQVYFRYYSFLGISAAILFILRQIQVIAGAGLTVWKMDFLYQILNRLHLENLLFKDDWGITTNDFYVKESILNPGFAPYTEPLVRLKYFLVSVGSLIFSNISHVQNLNEILNMVIGICFSALVIVTSLCGILGLKYHRRRLASKITVIASQLGVIGVALVLGYGFYNNWINITGDILGWFLFLIVTISTIHIFYLPLEMKGFFNKDRVLAIKYPTQKLNLFSFVLIIATTIMYFIFPTYFMLVFPSFLIAPCFIVIWTISILSPIVAHWDNRKSSIIALLLIIAIKLLTMLPNIIESRTPSDHVDVLRQLKGQCLVSNFTPASISSFTHSFSGFLHEKGFLNLIKNKEVTTQDYFMLFERDRLENPLYKKPSYALFYKRLGSKEQLKLIKNLNPKIVQEGESYILFEITNEG